MVQKFLKSSLSFVCKHLCLIAGVVIVGALYIITSTPIAVITVGYALGVCGTTIVDTLL